MNISLSVFKTKNNPSFLVRLPVVMASSQGSQLIQTDKGEVEKQAFKIKKLKFADILCIEKKRRRSFKMWIITLKFFSEMHRSHLSLSFLLYNYEWSKKPALSLTFVGARFSFSSLVTLAV